MKNKIFSSLFLIFLTWLSCAWVTLYAQNNENTQVKIETTHGDITLQLYDETPQHKENFIKLIEEGFYDSLLFHRVINQFMIQGGDPESKGAEAEVQLGEGGPGYTVPAEFHPHLYHKKGALAAARKGDNVNPEKASSGSQFYIVQGKVFEEKELRDFETKMNQKHRNGIFNELLAQEENKPHLKEMKKLQRQQNFAGIDSIAAILEPQIDSLLAVRELTFQFTEKQIELYTTIGGTPHLDGSYTVFGEVIEGLEVVDKIAQVKTNRQNRPIEDVVMHITLIRKD